MSKGIKKIITAMYYSFAAMHPFDLDIKKSRGKKWYNDINKKRKKQKVNRRNFR